MFLEDGLDVVVVQETKVESQDGTDRMVQPFTGRYYVCVSHATGTSAGWAVFLRNSIDIVVEKVIVNVYNHVPAILHNRLCPPSASEE
ncbi:hypothetical protein HPB48_016221 [Haemaphysalis longicornis]|uniref:Uncharacterized protein n=1 Tax=Haemaphysalis longicornis TaxID=44386 RepID=A0A9J6F9Z4_HAELO|nr:hypothetical protein HPB48_016221 [Haemaphysalis longicornis]